MTYSREIDGLRAFAVLAVIFFHAGIEIFSGGFFGVDIFFVISGYLITSTFIEEKKANTFVLMNFYERRARRILPALFLVILVSLPVGLLILLPWEIKLFSESIVATSLFISNIYFWRSSGYFDAASELKPLLHLWSLALEEQYYLIFPIFFMLIWRFGRHWLLKLLLTSFVVSLLFAQWIVADKPVAAFYLLPTRSWEFLVGALTACHVEFSGGSIASNAKLEISSLIGMAMIFFAILAFDFQTPNPSLLTLVPTIGAALIILHAKPVTCVGKILGSRVLVNLGLVSYSAYLWHQPMYAFARHLAIGQSGGVVICAMIAGPFIFAYFSWKYVEMPFRGGGIGRKRFAIGAFILSISLIGFGYAGHVTNGFERFKSLIPIYRGDVGHEDFYKYMQARYFECSPKSIAQKALYWGEYIRCMSSKKEQQIDFALIGDSHAEHLFLGLAEALPNKNIVFYIKDSYLSPENPEFEDAFKYLLEAASIKTVFLAMHWSGRLKQFPRDKGFQESVRKSISLLRQAGKTVFLVDDVPKFSFPPEICKFTFSEITSTHCVMSKNEVFNYEKKYVPTLEYLAMENNVRLINLRNLFCDDLSCTMLKNDFLMYRDDNHLNIYGSQYVGKEIILMLPQLNE